MLICRGIDIAWSVVRTFRFMFYVCFDYWLGLCVALPVTAGGTTIAKFLTRGLTSGWRIAIMLLPWVFLIALMQRRSQIHLAVERLWVARGWLGRVSTPLSPASLILHGVVAFVIFFVTLVLADAALTKFRVRPVSCC